MVPHMDDLWQRLPAPGRPLSPELNHYFDQLRGCADEQVDALVNQTLSSGNFRLGGNGYNHLLDIADVIAEAPELVLNSNTHVAQQLESYPENLKDYFDPSDAPDWVDVKKLNIATRLWNDDSVGMLGVLYALSLPACYLIKNGIPALYQTAKLREKKYIYQRIYETGLMLETVLSHGGIKVVYDMATTTDERMEATSITNGSPLRGAPRRYLYGKGYITAKKIRFLHASMRLILLNPGVIPASAAPQLGLAKALHRVGQRYDVESLGLPVNQEDLAYTLLTFGYCIPLGLQKWGRQWTTEEKEAFLHIWKVIGYLMGIREDLLTDNWDQAQRLFLAIQSRQAGTSEQGKVLTETLMSFLCDYLPDHFQLDKSIAAGLIQSQLGLKHAAMLLSDEQQRAVEQWPIRIALGAGLFLLRNYYRVRAVLSRVPVLHRFFRNTIDMSGEALIESWHDAYNRRPYYIPANAQEWVRVKGVNEAYLTGQGRWRRQLFNTVGLGLLGLIVASTALVTLPLFALFGSSESVNIAVWVAGGSAALGILSLRFGVEAVRKKRPHPADVTPVEANWVEQPG